MVDEAAVRAWLKAVGERILGNTAEVARLQAEITVDTRRQAALKALLAASADGGAVVGALPTSSSEEPIRGQPQGVSVHPIERGAMEILGERGKPLHISDLRAELSRRGIPIPGKGTDANVIVYLSRCTHICRVGRGLYALRTWEVPEVPARRRRSVRKKRTVRGSRKRKRAH